jgi:amino acid adenylation domain-containing protein
VNEPTYATLSDAKRALIRRRLDGHNQQRRDPAPSLHRDGQLGPAPLSVAQEQLWYFSQLAPHNPVYNEAVTICKDGPFDVKAFRDSFREILRRHEIWRSTYELRDGEPIQVVHQVPELQLPLVDLSHLPWSEAEQEAAVIAAEQARRAYSLEHGPLVRPTLVKLSADHHRLYLALHHIVFDGFSLYRIILPELIALYDAHNAAPGKPLAPPRMQYGDYAAQSRQSAESEAFALRLAYWREHLAHTPSLQLPCDHSRPPTSRFRGSMLPLRISRDLADRLRSLSRRSGATLFQVMATAFAVLLHRLSGQEEIVFGAMSDLRDRVELESMVGYCLTPLVIRSSTRDEPSFMQLISCLREDLLSGLEHAIPFDRVVREINPDRVPGANPVFQAAIALEPPPPALDGSWSLHQMEAAIGNSVGHAKFDLHLELDERPEGHIDGRLIFNTDLFEPQTAERMADNWQTLLRSIVDDPDIPVSTLRVLSDAERHRQLFTWNATQADYPRDACVHDLVAAQALRTPAAIALEFGDRHLTFAEVDRSANRVAHRLQALGARAGTLVALCVERSPEMVCGMLGILKSGAAYLPLGPGHPTTRLANTLADSGADILVTQSALLSRFSTPPARTLCLDVERLDDLDGQAPEHSASAQDLAYVSYTSGSTGRPNGVGIQHRALVNFLASMAKEPGMGETDTLVAVTTYAFDIAALEIWLPLITGARCVLATSKIAADGFRLAQLLDSSAATMLQATPSTWQLLIDAGWRGRPGLVALCGGEALPARLADSLLDRVATVWNMYGPTETTVWSTLARVERGLPITIGRPIANTRVYVLDKHLNPVPVGVAGEIVIGGDGLTQGYLNRPELTAARILNDPWTPGARMYRTGDLGRYLLDGRLEHLGRIDQQVKVRGFRIEPGEVEAALLAHPDVASVVVIAREDAPADKRLVAYVVSKERTPSAAELRDLTRSALPEYMIPSAFVAIDALPRTPNGKLDRSSLPVPSLDDHTGMSTPAPPNTELERCLAEVWARALNLEKVGVEDNFFDLGGHSLLAVRLRVDIERVTGVDIPLASIFAEAGTISGMAALIEAGGPNGGWRD